MDAGHGPLGFFIAPACVYCRPLLHLLLYRYTRGLINRTQARERERVSQQRVNIASVEHGRTGGHTAACAI